MGYDKGIHYNLVAGSPAWFAADAERGCRIADPSPEALAAASGEHCVRDARPARGGPSSRWN
jgi:hypothetical protein